MNDRMTIFVTGGAGFIGSAVVRHLLSSTGHRVVNLDKLTYAGNLESLAGVHRNPNYTFVKVDLCDAVKLRDVFAAHRPDAVMHLAAESHVDRSIDEPAAFITTNIVGTYTLLEAAREYWTALDQAARAAFRFHHVSTDEVFGDLGAEDPAFCETTPYAPSSPYAASKASADHLVRAWHRTYGLPVLVSNSSNNYGPYQFPEKLIPTVVQNALSGQPIPVYGTGSNVRDWLYVDDHARALHAILTRGVVGSTYAVGGRTEMSNIDVVRAICAELERRTHLRNPNINRYEDLIRFVPDRPGHDRRYAVDTRKIEAELAWSPLESFATGIGKTVSWYLENTAWTARVQNGSYRGERLGLKRMAAL